MNRSLLRIIACLLIPSLLTDAVTASVASFYDIPVLTGSATSVPSFTRQAIPAKLLLVHPEPAPKSPKAARTLRHDVHALIAGRSAPLTVGMDMGLGSMIGMLIELIKPWSGAIAGGVLALIVPATRVRLVYGLRWMSDLLHLRRSPNYATQDRTRLAAYLEYLQRLQLTEKISDPVEISYPLWMKLSQEIEWMSPPGELYALMVLYNSLGEEIRHDVRDKKIPATYNLVDEVLKRLSREAPSIPSAASPAILDSRPTSWSLQVFSSRETESHYKQLNLEPLSGDVVTLLNEWTPRSIFTPAGSPSPLENDLYNPFGFQLRSIDSQGHSHLEGWVTFEPRAHGLYLSYIEVAPWNRQEGGRKLAGVGSLLVNAVVRESVRQGFDGVVSVFTAGERAKRFFKNKEFGGFWKYQHLIRTLQHRGLLNRFLSPQGAEELLLERPLLQPSPWVAIPVTDRTTSQLPVSEDRAAVEHVPHVGLVAIAAGVLSPRTASTELFVQLITQQSSRFTGDVLDLGTGTGVLAVALKRAGATHVIGVDVVRRAIRTAERTRRLQNDPAFTAGIQFAESDLYERLDRITGRSHPQFDAIVFHNPIYAQRQSWFKLLSHAVNAGRHFEVNRCAIAGLPTYLKPGGSAYMLVVLDGIHRPYAYRPDFWSPIDLKDALPTGWDFEAVQGDLKWPRVGLKHVVVRIFEKQPTPKASANKNLARLPPRQVDRVIREMIERGHAVAFYLKENWRATYFDAQFSMQRVLRGLQSDLVQRAFTSYFSWLMNDDEPYLPDLEREMEFIDNVIALSSQEETLRTRRFVLLTGRALELDSADILSHAGAMKQRYWQHFNYPTIYLPRSFVQSAMLRIDVDGLLAVLEHENFHHVREGSRPPPAFTVADLTDPDGHEYSSEQEYHEVHAAWRRYEQDLHAFRDPGSRDLPPFLAAVPWGLAMAALDAKSSQLHWPYVVLGIVAQGLMSYWKPLGRTSAELLKAA